MQLEATALDLMGHKTITSEYFLFEPKTFQSDVRDSALIGHLLRWGGKGRHKELHTPENGLAVEDSILAVEFSGFSEIKWSALTPTERALSRKTLSFPLLPTQNDAVLKVLLIYIFMFYSRWPGRYIHFNIPTRKRTSLFSVLLNAGKAVGLFKKTFFFFKTFLWVEGICCPECNVWILPLCQGSSKWACRTVAMSFDSGEEGDAWARKSQWGQRDLI